MTFSPQDLGALIDLVERDSQLRHRLALAMAGEELLRLPTVLTGLTESQVRLEAAMANLAEAQARTEERVGRLEAVLSNLAEAQVRTEASVAKLIDTVAEMRGDFLESRYHRSAPAIFGPVLRGVAVVESAVLDREIEPHLSRADFTDVLRLDLILSGRHRYMEHASEVWLAVEVSAVIDRDDIDRARRRAAFLRQAGRVTVPVVAGESLTAGAESALAAGDVVLVRNGRMEHWEEALKQVHAA